MSNQINNLPEGWVKTTLGEIIDIFSGKTRPKEEGMYPVYGGNGILSYGNNFNQEDETLIVGRVGAYCGNVFFENKKFWLSDNALGIKNNLKSNIKFLYYKLIDMRLNNYAIGGAQPLLTQSLLKQLEIIIPSISEQKAIASVLSSFDDKIELLKQQNKTLEKLAQTIFNEWFVNNPKENWTKKPLDEIAEFLNGVACQKYPPKDSESKLPVLKIKELSSGITENSDWCSSNVDEKYYVNHGDVIFSWSGSLMIKIWNGEKCVLNQHLFKVSSKDYPKWFYFYWSKHHLNKFIAIAKSKATTMGHIKRSDLSNSVVLVPSDKELEQLHQVLKPILSKKIDNLKQITDLQNSRDTLLPELMTGKVKVIS